MISKIEMSNIASYKSPSALETDKKINLIYGLNGMGKTVLSTFLYDPKNPAYAGCKIHGLQSEKVLVYNEKFIEDNFHEAENLKGIFTLSKENKAAEEAIQKAMQQIKNLEEEYNKASHSKTINEAKRQKARTDTENTVWEIKTTYSGGDRVFEFCLENLKAKKESLFNHIRSIANPGAKPSVTIDSLKREVELLQSQGTEEIDSIPLITFPGNGIEDSGAWKQVLVGNENSVVATLIEKLNNSDWIKKGIEFLGTATAEESAICPFCQQETITTTLRDEIKGYFDENYERSLEALLKLHDGYERLAASVTDIPELGESVFALEKKKEVELAHANLARTIEVNIARMRSKIQQPSQVATLEATSKYVTDLNSVLSEINAKIAVQNQKIRKKVETLATIKSTFWAIMRFEYNQTLSRYDSEIKSLNDDDAALDKVISAGTIEVAKLTTRIADEQKNTVNIDEAVQNINAGLIELGIESFSIVKYQEIFYKISRECKVDKTFKTLSEGEKMIISFLYFRELCRGRVDTQDTSTKKIVIIDDPISSLSHIYVFNVGRLIKNTFLRSEDYDQVFVLTHSLYFFYEIVETDHVKRKESHKLFRVSKNPKGSYFLEMKYEEIQSDYQAYWYMIRDVEQPVALIANSMRNILEYFFNFIEKRDLNNLFLKPELSAVRFQAFNRFINRESHSLGQNIFDYKEFNYEDFRDAFKLIFVLNGYEEHYSKMMKK